MNNLLLSIDPGGWLIPIVFIGGPIILCALWCLIVDNSEDRK